MTTIAFVKINMGQRKTSKKIQKMIEIRVQKNGQKVIHFQTAHKTGELRQNRSQTTLILGHSKNPARQKKKKKKCEKYRKK
jgi:hypothetical protein